MKEPKIVPLRSDAHRNLKVRDDTFRHVESTHMVPVTAQEFTRLGAEYPIVFVKNSETGRFLPVALLGLEVGENLFVDGDQWRGIFVPGSIRNHPFVLSAVDGERDQLTVCLIESSPLVSEEAGNSLFSDSGEETDYVKRKKEALTSFLQCEQLTRAFVGVLAERELLSPQTVTVSAGELKINLKGLYIVDEKKLSELSDEDFADFRKRGFLPPLYAQLSSMHQFPKLARMQAEHRS